MASSPRMLPENILSGCQVKGISIIGTGDILHPEWRKMWENTPVPEGMVVVPTTEVENTHRVHHLILLRDLESGAELASRFEPYTKSLTSNGRPHLSLPSEVIAREVHDLGGLIGPAHAFTPWTSIYASFSSIAACYGDEKIDLLELGLSADSSYGDKIPDLATVPFLTNSDAHSPEPAKLGREFTRLQLSRPETDSVLEAVKRGNIELNVGFFPEEGKYNQTACSRCFKQYSRDEAEKSGWRCPEDKGIIKKGVKDRALELSSGKTTRRPPYLHIIPLAEIIQRSLNASSTTTKKCRDLYTTCIQTFGDEITILTITPAEDIAKVDRKLGVAMAAFREGDIILHPGGGGQYGSFEFPY